MGKIHEDYMALLTLCKIKPKDAETKQKINEFHKFIETCEQSILNELDEEYKQTILHKCAMVNDTITAAKILARTNNVNTRDENDCTPLYYALLMKNVLLIKLLIKNGANINETDVADYTYLHHATIAGDAEKIKILLGYGANLFIKDGVYQSLLHRIVADSELSPEKKLEIITIFLNHGAGLYCDLTDIEIPTECCTNAILMGATKNELPINNIPKEFKESIFTVAQFLAAVEKGISFNFCYLLLMTNYLIKQKTPQTQPQTTEESQGHVQAHVDQNNILQSQGHPQAQVDLNNILQSQGHPQAQVDLNNISQQANLENVESIQANPLAELIKFRDCLTVLVNNQEKLSLKQTIFRFIARHSSFFTSANKAKIELLPVELLIPLQEIEKEQQRQAVNQNKKP